MWGTGPARTAGGPYCCWSPSPRIAAIQPPNPTNHTAFLSVLSPPPRLSDDAAGANRPGHGPGHDQLLSFSPDGRWLVSVGRDPERAVVVWDMAGGQLVAAGRTEGATAGVAWLRGGPAPVFATAGADGLLLWSLQDR